jgi:transcriptional regulator with XRE-family HTH domain
MTDRTGPPTVPFGTWIRRAREMNGLSQKDLSGLTGIVQSTLSSIEHGVRLPTFENCVVLAAELGVNQHEAVARMVKEQLLRTDEGRIFLAEVRDGRLYDDEEYQV